MIYELKSATRESAIRELVETLRKAGQVSVWDVPGMVRALFRREELGSTGIGRGFAVPHTKHPRVTKLTGAFGRSSGGIEFKAMDGKPSSHVAADATKTTPMICSMTTRDMRTSRSSPGRRHSQAVRRRRQRLAELPVNKGGQDRRPFQP